MSPALAYSWFLPLGPDVHHIGTWPAECGTPSLDRLVDIAVTAEAAGCQEMLVPTSFHNDLETFTTAAAVLGRTSRIGMLLAVRPNQLHPVQAAAAVCGLEALFPGRIRLNLTTGGWAEDRWLGDFESKEVRSDRLEEWLEVLHEVLYADTPVRHKGRFYEVDGAALHRRPERRIPLAMSGSSPRARQLLSRFGDEYLMFAGPLPKVAAEVETLRATPGIGTAVRVTLRTHLVVREDEQEAWAAAAEIVSRVQPNVRATIRAQRPDARSQRAGQNELAAGDDLVVGPNLWAGIGTGRFGASVAIVGTPAQVIDRLLEFRSAGVDGFILSGYPKLEEARVLQRLLVPELLGRGLAPDSAVVARPV
ncbi:LLM class flavin-dependent oxidoreductase [Streptomyces sp. NPDC053750]|uniref:LLM class flavin-dependent oxidoreductase n=1 Tax=Streptomyces sp. NPDC053750 TaxID=3365714 RepID=UPI0037CF376C